MRFSPECLPHLRGEQFSSAFRLELKGGPDPLRERVELICALVAGRSVIHLGCADHLPTIAGKMKAGKWLHGRLAEAAVRLAGIDLDREAIAHLTGLGIPDLHCLDLTRDELPATISGNRWDFLVLGELLEHVGNPEKFLVAVRDRFSPIAETIIVSVPNAFRLSNFEQARNGVELSNSDHRHYYSPYTLARTLSAAGFTPRDIHFCVYEIPALSRRVFLQQWLWKRRMRKYPLLRDVIVMVADMK